MRHSSGSAAQVTHDVVPHGGKLDTTGAGTLKTIQTSRQKPFLSQQPMMTPSRKHQSAGVTEIFSPTATPAPSTTSKMLSPSPSAAPPSSSDAAFSAPPPSTARASCTSAMHSDPFSELRPREVRKHKKAIAAPCYEARHGGKRVDTAAKNRRAPEATDNKKQFMSISGAVSTSPRRGFANHNGSTAVFREMSTTALETSQEFAKGLADSSAQYALTTRFRNSKSLGKTSILDGVSPSRDRAIQQQDAAKEFHQGKRVAAQGLTKKAIARNAVPSLEGIVRFSLDIKSQKFHQLRAPFARSTPRVGAPPKYHSGRRVAAATIAPARKPFHSSTPVNTARQITQN